jgi:hypothetical protein
LVFELPLPDELVALSAGGLEQTLVATEQVRRMVEATLLDVIELADQRGSTPMTGMPRCAIGCKR